MHTVLWTPLVASLLVTATVGTHQLSSAQQILDQQLVSACRAGDAVRLDSLIKSNRLRIKPIVDSLLAVAIRSDLAGRSREFRTGVETARMIGGAFERVHGEKSLAIAVSYVPNWSKKQRQLKLLADSVQTLGIRLRAKAEMRDSALALFQSALANYRSLKDQRGEGNVLGGIGFIYWYKKDPDRALRYFSDGLKIRLAVDDRLLVGNGYNDIGSVYYAFLKDYPKAIENHRQAERVRREIGDNGGLGRTLDNLALDYWDMGDLREALRCCEEAAQTHAKAGDQDRVSRSLHNSGILLTDLGRYPQALLAHDRTLEIRQKLGDKAKIAETLDAKGVVYYRMGDLETAYACYQQALSMMEEAGDERGVAAASYKSGVILSDLGRREQAFEAYQKSLDVAQRIGDVPTSLHVLSNMGVAYIDMKQYAKAEEVLQKALAISRELPDVIVEIMDLTMLGNAQNLQGRVDSARQNYRSALEKARVRENPELMWAALLGLGDLEEKRRAYQEAIDYYTQALECIDRIRGSIVGDQFKISFTEKKRYVYEAIVHLMTTLHGQNTSAGYDARAFRVAESAKARAFLDLLSESLANIRDGADPLLAAREDSLVGQVNAARQQLELLAEDPQKNEQAIGDLKSTLDLAEREIRRVEDELRTSNPRLAELKNPEPATIEECQKNVLDARTILLEYAVGDSSSSLWVVTKGQRQLLKLPDRQSLKDQIDILRSALTSPASSSLAMFRSAARRLYSMVIAPAERYLPKGMRLLIVPDAELNYVPFEVLLTNDDGDSYGNLPYLIHRHPIVYIQSATVMRTLLASRRVNPGAFRKELIAFGDPVFSDAGRPGTGTGGTEGAVTALREKLVPLPYTEAEVNGIGKMFPAGTADVYLRSEATEERAKQKGELANYRFIHFATHGLINERKPDLSALVLSRGADLKEDGLLQSSEIFGLDLSAELVTLSACQTGLGKMARGEGLVGLTRAFMYAGAPSVVVSLWSVSDFSTALLMQDFYRGMVNAGSSKDEALRSAKLALCTSEKYSNPFYWAPFVVIGDWELKR